MKKLALSVVLAVCASLAAGAEVKEVHCVEIARQGSLTGAITGGAVGGAAGAAIGHALGGKTGAWIGGALGGVGGSTYGENAMANKTYQCAVSVLDKGKVRTFSSVGPRYYAQQRVRVVSTESGTFLYPE